MFNVTAMRKLLVEAKRKATKYQGNQTSKKDSVSFGGEFGGVNKLDESLFSSINASIQKDVALLLSISSLDAHSLWLKTAHDRKKLIKEVLNDVM